MDSTLELSTVVADSSVGEDQSELDMSLGITDCSCNHDSDEEGDEFEVFQEFEEAEYMIEAVSVNVTNEVNEEDVIETIGYTLDHEELMDHDTQSRYDSKIS